MHTILVLHLQSCHPLLLGNVSVLAVRHLCLEVQEHLLSFSGQRVAVKDYWHAFAISSEG